MNIQETINADLKTAMKEKNENVKSILRVVIGEFNREGKEVTDEKALSIIKKMMENAKELGNENEVIILETYLPKQISEGSLRDMVGRMVQMNNITSIKDMGKVMQWLKVKHGGHYDGKVAAKVVREILH